MSDKETLSVGETLQITEPMTLLTDQPGLCIGSCHEGVKAPENRAVGSDWRVTRNSGWRMICLSPPKPLA
jgi:hypothetical protein